MNRLSTERLNLNTTTTDLQIVPVSGNDVQIVLTDFELPPAEKARLEDPRWHHRLVNVKEAGLDEVDLDEVDAMILGSTPRFKPVEKTKNLKFVQTITAGVDQIDLSVFPEETIVCSNAGAFAEPMAETVFAFLLAFAKNLPSFQDELKAGGFPRWTTKGIFLKGKTIGVIGAGGIGRATAKLAKGFGMRVIGIASRPRKIDDFDSVGTLDDLDRLLSESDFVVVSIPLTVRTRGLINRKKLNKMKKNAIFVNVARGPVVVEKDLYDHLKENPEFRAGIDVWWKYPKKGEQFRPDYPFPSLKNVLMTPHSSAMVPEVNDMAAAKAVDNVIRFFRGQSPTGVVNRSEYVSVGPSPASN